jgi:hypothetical protein
VGKDSIVGIVTRYGWTVQGSNPGGGEILCTHSDWPWGLPSLLAFRILYQCDAVATLRYSFLGSGK